MPALAVTDHGNMYAAVEFFLKAKELGVKPIIGCELYIAPRTRFDKDSQLDRKRSHATALVKNALGYQNLLKLVSLASIEGFYSRPRVDRELLEKYHEGLIILSGCAEGEISQLLQADQYEAAVAKAKWYQQLWGDDFYLEIMDVGLAEFKPLKEKLIKFATRIPVFMYLTDYRERTLRDVITKLEPGLFKKVTGLTQKDFVLWHRETMEIQSDQETALKKLIEEQKIKNNLFPLGIMRKN